MNKRIILFLLPMIFCQLSFSQDIHFSQFYNSPLILNPALTGNSDCLIRLGGNYRNQWSSVTVPYKTFSFFADCKLDPRFLGRTWFGVGASFYNDVAGDGNLSTTDAAFCFSFNMPLSKKNKIIMSIGATVEYMSKTVKLGSFYFDNQWNGSGFDPSISSNEPFASDKFNHLDFDVGMLLHGETRKGFSYHFGSVLNHISMPREHFTGSMSKLGWKIVAHGGVNAEISRTMVISPKIYFSYQDGAKEILFGTNFSKKYTKKSKLLFGIWYRWSGDIIGTLGFDLSGFQLMLSYDANISKLKVATKSFGGFEVSLIKTFLCGNKSFFKKQKGKIQNCPIF